MRGVLSQAQLLLIALNQIDFEGALQVMVYKAEVTSTISVPGGPMTGGTLLTITGTGWDVLEIQGAAKGSLVCRFSGSPSGMQYQVAPVSSSLGSDGGVLCPAGACSIECVAPAASMAEF